MALSQEVAHNVHRLAAVAAFVVRRFKFITKLNNVHLFNTCSSAGMVANRLLN